jgi:hypothetical protein
MMRWADHVVHMEDNTYKILVGKTEGKRPIGKFRRRWEDNFKRSLRETG